MKVIQVFINNPLRNFNYIIYSEKTKEAIFTDPTDLSKTLPVAEELGITPKYLINTHRHYDHIADNEKFLQMKGTQYLELEDGEEFSLSDGEKLIARYTPGHVPEHTCFFLYQQEKLTGIITGDTVFNGGVGNCKMGGNPSELYQTIRDVFVPLDDDIIIYPSHDYFLSNLKFSLSVEPENSHTKEYIAKREKQDLDNEFMLTTIGEEKLYNPFFRVFNNSLNKHFDLNEEDLFIELRSKRDRW